MMAANIHLPFNNNGLTINWPQIQQTRTILIGKIQKLLHSLLHDIKNIPICIETMHPFYSYFIGN